MSTNTYLELFIVPGSIDENDTEGFKHMKTIIDCLSVPVEDKLVINQLLMEFNVMEFPKLIILNMHGDMVTQNALSDIVT